MSQQNQISPDIETIFPPLPTNNNNPIADQNMDDINANNDYMEVQDNPIAIYNNRIRELQEKEQILKFSVSDHQQAVKNLFNNLYNRKKDLLALITNEYNMNKFEVDIGVMEEFMEMRKIIENQQHKIEKLKNQIDMQGLAESSISNYQNIHNLKQKKNDLQHEIQNGSKFAASQYVRDYLERTYIHKVSYEDVKYEYEMKIKLKENLDNEKYLYERKKEQLKKAIEKEGMLKKELQEEKSRLEVLQLAKQTNGK